MKEKDLLFGVLTKALVKTDQELEQLIYDQTGELKSDALDALLSQDADRVRRIRKEADGTGFNNGYKKGTAETMTDVEKQFKQKFNYNSDAQGLDLIEEFIGKQAKTTLNIDDVRKHPAYLELERSTVKKDEYNKVVTDFEQFKTGLERSNMMSKIHNKALEMLDKSKPQIEDNPVIANKRKQTFLSEFNKYDYEFEGDYPVPVKDGKRVQDAHGNALSFENLVKDTIEGNFVINQQTYRQSSGNSGSGGVSVPIARNKEEYMKMIVAEKDPQKRVAIKAAYEQANK